MHRTNSTGTAPVNVVYTVTPLSADGCAGAPFTVTITILPAPAGNALPATQILCSNAAINPIVLTTNNNLYGTTVAGRATTLSNVTGRSPGKWQRRHLRHAAQLLGAANEPVNYTITPTSAAGCAGAPFSALLTVKPEPLGTATPATQTLCSDASITPIVLTTTNNLSGTSYAWTRNNTANVTVLPNSGSGNPAGTPNNKTGSEQTQLTPSRRPPATAAPGRLLRQTWW